MKKTFRLTAGCCIAVALGALAGPARAELLDRGNGMIYDTASNLTWLQNADLAGLMTWSQAMSWADGLEISGYSDWRLPAVLPANGVSLNLDYSEDNSTDGGINKTGLNTELGYLFYVSLGNNAETGLTNAGPFTNAQSFAYWTGTTSPFAGEALHFFTAFGDQGSSPVESQYNAWAVRTGDVTPVPEPGSFALLLAGLLAVGVRVSRTRGGRA